MKLSTVACAAFCLVLGVGLARASGPDEAIVGYELPNGLDVVLAPDHRAPKVV